ERAQPEHQRVRARAHADRVADPEEGGRLALERIDVRSEDEAPGAQNAEHGLFELGPEALRLLRQIDHGNLRGQCRTSSMTRRRPLRKFSSEKSSAFARRASGASV